MKPSGTCVCCNNNNNNSYYYYYSQQECSSVIERPGEAFGEDDPGLFEHLRFCSNGFPLRVQRINSVLLHDGFTGERLHGQSMVQFRVITVSIFFGNF